MIDKLNYIDFHIQVDRVHKSSNNPSTGNYKNTNLALDNENILLSTRESRKFENKILWSSNFQWS